MNRKPPTVVSSRRDAGGRDACTTVVIAGPELRGAGRSGMALPKSPSRSASPKPRRDDASFPAGRVGRSSGRPALSRAGAQLADGFFLLLAVSVVAAGLALLLYAMGVGS